MWEIFINTNLEGITLSAVSQTKKDKYCRISLKCGSKKHTEIETRTVFTRAKGVGSRRDVGQRVLPVIK